MSSENQDDLVTNFTTVTGVDADRARFYLEASGWNLDLAMGSFYQDDDEGGADDSPPAARDSSPPTQQDAAWQPKPQTRFATLASMGTGNSDSDSGEEGEAFYAGGSERSGQQILGPPKKKKNKEELIKEMFDSAKEHGAEVIEAGSAGARGGGENRPMFGGTGYRLGDTEDAPVDVVRGPRVPLAHSEVDMVLKFWKNGFSIDDGTLRDFRNPENAAFLQSIKQGDVPSELTRLARGGEVNLNMEDHSAEEFVKPKVPMKAFSGDGQRLGSATPAVTVSTPSENKSNESAAESTVTVNDSQPTTSVQIRLADGSRLVAKFNHSHTVGDIRSYIEAARPQQVGATYVLMTTFPNNELTDLSQTLSDAKLLGSAIVQRMK